MAKQKKISIEYPGGTDNAAFVTFVGPNEARLETDPMHCLFTDDEDELRSLPDLQDLVELEKSGWGKYRFVRVLQRARLQRFEFLLSDPETQAKALEPILSRIMELGGDWDRIFGGVLTIFLPHGCSYDPTKDVSDVLIDPRRD
jgi:hypothetical protein